MFVLRGSSFYYMTPRFRGLDEVSATMSRKMIGMVVPIDYLSIQGGASQRIKADLAALVHSGYDVETIFPSAVSQPQHGAQSAVTPATYLNIQQARFLPEKIRLLFDMFTQMFNPFFRSSLQKRYQRYSVILAYSFWSVVASYKVVKQQIPLLYVAFDFEYGRIRQVTRNLLICSLIYYVEKYACQKATKILCVSERDMKNIEKTYGVPKAKLSVLPNTVDVDFFAQTHELYDKGSERQKFGLAANSLLLLFQGRMDYRPNLDALEFILDELVPALSCPARSMRIVVAGARIPKRFLDSKNEIVSFYSDIPDMRRFLSIADAVIVPLSIGGGTRLKILESFAARVPVISTAEGAEGIECDDSYHFLATRRSATDFINKVMELAENETLRQKLISNAFNLVVQKYSIAVASRCLKEVIMQAENQTKQTEDV